MIHIPILLIIKALIALMATGAVVMTVSYLNYLQAQRIAKEAAQRLQNVSRVVVENIEKGNVNRVKIGLFDDQSSRVGKIEINTPELENDITEGDVLYYA